MNKVLVKLYVPMLEVEYDIWLPSNKKMYRVMKLLIKAVNEFTDNNYTAIKTPILYDKQTAKIYDPNLTVKENNIQNGAELVLV